MREIADKQESSAQGSAAKKFVAKCPECGHTRFSVEVIAYQGYDGETDGWSVCELREVIKDGLETSEILG